VLTEPINSWTLEYYREQDNGLHRLSVDAMLQRHAVEKLHGNERLPIHLVNLMDGANVRVV
jgi:hypothetical protein